MQMENKLIRALNPIRSSTLLIFSLLAQTSFAQMDPSPVYNEQLRVLLDQQSPSQRNVSLDGGGWFNFGLFDYDDGPNQERTLRQSQLRGWFNVNKQDTHKVYVRGVFNYDDWNSNTNPLGRGDDANERLERAWYGLNVNRLLGWDIDGPVNLDVKAGRDFQTIGNAFTLSIPLDMLHVKADIYPWQITAFGGKTIFRSYNIDESPLLVNRQDRILWGTEIVYERFSEHRPFVYVLFNYDHTDPAAPSPFQSYKYDSRYLGIGSRGVIGSDDLRYAWELVGEWGKTYSTGVTSGRDHIEAYGFDLLLEYYLDHATRPKLMFEYLFGSGDSDRLGSPVATAGGNLNNTSDKAFNAFGFRDTGIALAPVVSNLHIFSGGVSLFPFDHSPQFKALEVGGKTFFYVKHRKDGAISDPSAANNEGWVGFEWDLFCNWRLSSDLAWTTRYGMFHPGSACDGTDKSPRHFIYSGMILSF